MTELYINGRRMDIDGETVIARTFQQNLLTSQGSVDSPYTNSFSLPFTKTNAEVLGNPEEASSLTDAPYVKLDCVIIQDGIEQFPNSIAEVQGFEDNRYTVQVFAGAVPFFDLLGDSNIRDLDFSEYRHVWNYANVVAGGVEGVYVYDLIDRGKPLNLARLHPSLLYPSVYAKAIWSKIFASVGVPIQMEEPEEFPKLKVPFANEHPIVTQAFIDQYTDQYAVTSETRNGEVYTGIKVPIVKRGELKVTMEVELTSFAEPVTAYFSLEKGGQYVPFSTKTTEFNAIGKNVFSATYRIEAGEDLTGLVLYSHLPSSSDTTFSYSSYVLKVTYGEEAYFGDEWDLSINLPDMKQKDFVLAMCKLFGWGLGYDAYKGEMKVKPLKNVALNIGNAPDWTPKVDYFNKPRTHFKLPDTAQSNLYKWKEDETVPSGLGDGIVVASNEHLEKERDAVDMPFAASEERNGLLYLPVFSGGNERLKKQYSITVANIAERNALGNVGSGTTVFVEDASDDPTIAVGAAIYTYYAESVFTGWFKEEQTEYESNSIEPRLVLESGGQLQFTLKMGDAVANVNRPAGRFAPLHFSVLIPKYYNVLQRILERVRMQTVPVRLTAQDFAELDSTVPVWMGDDYYYVNKVTDYISETVPCEAELIKLN